MLTTEWKTSSLNNGTCVAVRMTADLIQVKDFSRPDGRILTFTRAEWEAFLGGVKDGEFDI